MAEQYPAMLRKAITRVVGAEARMRVYVEARAALLEQLRATKAPSTEVAYQRVLLETAIQDVETEAVDAAYNSLNRAPPRAAQDRFGGALKGFNPGGSRPV